MIPWPRKTLLGPVLSLALLGVHTTAHASDEVFTIAVIPDTQNYVDYRKQTAEGFPFDARDLLIEQLQHVADNLESRGGEIAFVTAVGDIWQHPSIAIDPGHVARGFAGPSISGDKADAVGQQVRQIEIPGAIAAFRALDGVTPFSIVPGNHDYDARWVETARRIDGVHPAGVRHFGGLTAFTDAFGAQSDFFKDRAWYVASHDNGADSAQVFTAGGYRFLHIGLQFSASDASLQWAERVIHAHQGLPTIVTTHEFLNKAAKRKGPVLDDLNAVDPYDNNPQAVWDKLIRRNDQIFMVLSGHYYGQAFRQDENVNGRHVYQILTDYQGRRQTAIDAGQSPDEAQPVGDGWLRFLRFDFSAAVPIVQVQTYSTHYDRYASDAPADHSDWYRALEKPQLSDEEFLQAEDYSFPLTDFRARFANARVE